MDEIKPILDPKVSGLVKNISDVYSEKDITHIVRGLTKRLSKLRNQPLIHVNVELLSPETPSDNNNIDGIPLKMDGVANDLGGKSSFPLSFPDVAKDNLVKIIPSLSNIEISTDNLMTSNNRDGICIEPPSKYILKIQEDNGQISYDIKDKTFASSQMLKASSPILNLIEVNKKTKNQDIIKKPEFNQKTTTNDNLHTDQSRVIRTNVADEKITIVCPDCKFEVNKTNLMKMSPLMEWMIRRWDDKSFESKDISELTLNHLGLATNILRSILVYVNTSKGVLDVSYVTAHSILKAATLLEMQELIEAIKIFMVDEGYKNYITNATPTESWLKNLVTDLWPLAKRESLSNLSEVCEYYVGRHYRKLLKYPSVFLRLDFEQISRILERDDVCVIDEREVYESLLVWCQVHSITSEVANEHLGEIIIGEKERTKLANLIRYPQMKPADLFSCMSPHSVNILPVSEMTILKANWYIICKAHSANETVKNLFEYYPFSIKPRNYCSKLAGNESVSWIQLKYRFEDIVALRNAIFSQNTEELSKLIESRHSKEDVDHSVNKIVPKILEDVIVVVSGATNEIPLLIQVYKPKENVWAKNVSFAKLPSSRKLHQIAFVNECLYVIGGYEYVNTKTKSRKQMPVNSIYRYRDGKWDKITCMQTSRIYHSVAVLDDSIYVLGGQDENGNHLQTVERLDVKNQIWSYVSNLGSPRLAIASTAHNNMLWAVGGFENIDQTQSTNPVLSPIIAKVECYDPYKDKWLCKKDMRFSRCHASLIEVNGRLYLCGGATLFTHKTSSPKTIKNKSPVQPPTTITSMPVVDIYLDDLDTWTYVTGLKIPRHRAGIISLGSKIYIFGGVSSLSNSELNSVECYDVDKNEWLQDIEPIPLCSLGPVCCRVPLSCI